MIFYLKILMKFCIFNIYYKINYFLGAELTGEYGRVDYG